MSKLRLAPDLSLPDDAVTQRLAFVGRPGSGKSYMATKLAELLYDIGAQFIALDPVGIWYGVRADGKGKGLDIPVFGGLHGDVPLESGAGALIADLIVDRRLSCVLDVSQFATDTEKARFAAAFAERFFFRKKAAPSAVHLFLEECQEFVPQNTQRGEEHMLHHFTRMAKLGRNFGIGISLISQRPQEVNKKVFNLTECLFAFQMTGTHERKAIRDWVSAKGADEDIIAILPTWNVGVAHVYSPQWLGISQQVKAYEKRSADVSSTPTLGDAVRAESKPLAPSELAALTKAMAATIEKAKADDPRELRKEIAALRRQLEQKAKPGVKGQTDVEVRQHLARAVKFETRHLQVRLDRVVSAFRRYIDMVERHTKSAVEATGKLGVQSEQMRAALTEWESGASEAERTEAARTVVSPGEVGPSRQVVGRISQAPARPTTVSTAGDSSPGMQRILDALAELEQFGIAPAERPQVAMMAGYASISGGQPGRMVGALVERGLVAIPAAGQLALTEDGRRQAHYPDDVPTRKALHQRALAQLSDGEARILTHLIEIYPDAATRTDVAAATGYASISGGQPGRMVGRLVTLRFAEIPSAGQLKAGKILFPEGIR